MTNMSPSIVCTARRTSQTAVASIPRRYALSGIREMLSEMTLVLFTLAWELPT
jgi:hypothetical protein